MRTFIAIPLPAESRVVLEKAQSGLRAIGAAVRWGAVSSIHLTLKFLGEIDPALVTGLNERLAGATGCPPFDLEFEGLGGFPDLRNPRVIWCGLGGDTEALCRLQASVEEACAAMGFEAEARRFHPHLTLGRVQGRRNLRQLADYIKISPGPDFCFTADRFNVYKSVLTPQGPIYSILAQHFLRI